MIGTTEPAGSAALPFGDERRTPVTTDVVERGERAVGLTGDDDSLAVTLEADPVTRVLHLLGAGGEEPAAAEHLFTLQFELHRVGVDLSAEHAGPVVGHVLHGRTQANLYIATTRDIDHLQTPRMGRTTDL